MDEIMFYAEQTDPLTGITLQWSIVPSPFNDSFYAMEKQTGITFTAQSEAECEHCLKEYANMIFLHEEVLFPRYMREFQQVA